MILNKIKLNDFISHKSTELDLGYGINVVVGPNGAGKTSILDAVSFALFNDYSSRGRKESLINSKAKKCWTAVQFVEGGIKYSAEWSMERGRPAKGNLYRMQNGSKTLLAQGGSAVLAEIEKILAMDRSMFFQSIYVQQGEIEELVTAKPAARKTLISRLLGVEDLEKAWGGIRDVIDEYLKMQIELNTELSRRPSIESERQRHLATSTESTASIVSQKKELRKIEEKIISLQAILDKLKEDKKAFDILDKEKSILEKAVEHGKEKLETEQAELDNAIAAKKLVESLEEEISKLPLLEQYSQCIISKREQESKRQALEEKLHNLDLLEEVLKENEADSALYRNNSALREEKNRERKQHEGSDKALEKTMKTIKDLEKEEQKKKAALEKELNKSGETLEAPVTLENIEALLNQKRTELQNAKTELDESLDQYQKKMGTFEQREKELEDNLTKLEPSETEVKKCPTCETDLPAEKIAQLRSRFSSEKERITEELETAKSEITVTTQRRLQVEGQLKKVEKIELEQIKDKANQLDETREKVGKQTLEAETLAQNVATLQRLDGELTELGNQIGELEEPYMNYESARRELEKAQPKEKIMNEMKPVIEALEEVSQSTKESVSNLGYEPEKPTEELEALRQERQKYDQNIPTAKREPEYRERITATTQELSSKEQKLAETITSITELDYDEKQHSERQNELETEKGSRNELKEEIARLTENKRSADNEVANCDEKLEDLGEKEQEKKKVDKFIALLTKIRTAYGKDGVQKMIRARARPLLEASTRDLFERFNLAYSDVKIDDDYNIVVIGPSGEQQIEQISGGERVALAIALRLAITQVLSGRVETIIMDEPTTHLDEERRKELVNILSSFFRKGGRIIPQMLIITHHPEIVDVADVIYTIRKEDDYSIAEPGSPAIS
ncbi:MAG: AAA family ATPase [Candidatus Bathyarchaeia archaeon]